MLTFAEYEKETRFKVRMCYARFVTYNSNVGGFFHSMISNITPHFKVMTRCITFVYTCASWHNSLFNDLINEYLSDEIDCAMEKSFEMF